MAYEGALSAPHHVVIEERKSLTVSGVEDVERFDENSITLSPMRMRLADGADFSPGSCADHARRRHGPGGRLRAGLSAWGRVGPGLRRDAHRPAEFAAAWAGLCSGPAVLAGGHGGAVPAYPPAGRRAGAHLSWDGFPAGGRGLFPYAEPADAARAAVVGRTYPPIMAVSHRAGPPYRTGWKKSFERSKKALPKLAGMV